MILQYGNFDTFTKLVHALNEANAEATQLERQIEAKALRKLKHPSRAGLLVPRLKRSSRFTPTYIGRARSRIKQGRREEKEKKAFFDAQQHFYLNAPRDGAAGTKGPKARAAAAALRFDSTSDRTLNRRTCCRKR